MDRTNKRSKALLRNQNALKHGYRYSPEYRLWCSMKDRCLNPNATGYKNYGGRGIKICDRWLHFFENFLEDMGPRPPGRLGKRAKYTLERKDNDGDYTPDNCRWATQLEQVANQRPKKYSNPLITLTYEGETLPLSDWARRYGLKHVTLYVRVKHYGWDIERALTTPVKK